jgi:diadenylate cyclase
MMDVLISYYAQIRSAIHSLVNTLQITDIIDIGLLSYIVFKVIQLVRETRAEQLVKGIVFLSIGYYLSLLLKLRAVSFILVNVMQFAVLAMIVVFQPEVRRALEHIGRSRFYKFSILNRDDIQLNDERLKDSIASICQAVSYLQKYKIGGLILFERVTKLGDIIKTGTIVNADVSSDIIINIFFPKTPLHDGAMIIRDGRVYAAGCFLPLSQNQQLSRELGTRHRAALGISEEYDVVAVVVSEETGVISLAKNGQLQRNLEPEILYTILESELIPKRNEEKKSRKKGTQKEDNQ